MEVLSDNVDDIKDLAKKIGQGPEIKTRMPANPTVDLPGGYITPEGSLVKFATVKELTGHDEEFIARGVNSTLMLNNVLLRGVESLGHSAPTERALDDLLAGDRDAILLGIRKATFGNTIDGVINCPGCGARQDMLIDLDEDVEVVELKDPINDRIFELDLKAGRAVVTLPTGAVQKQLAEGANKSLAERKTIFLGGCLVSINDDPCIGAYSAASLGILDREALFTEIAKRNPGPRLEAVVKACKACGTEISVPLSLAEMFRI